MKVIDKRAKKMMTGMLEMWFVTGMIQYTGLGVWEVLSFQRMVTKED